MDKPLQMALADPVLSRLIWHDLKKLPTMLKVGIENWQDDNSQKSDSLVSMFRQLQAATYKQLLYLDNLSLLNKLELDSLQVGKEECEVKQFLHSLLPTLQLLVSPILVKQELNREFQLVTDLKIFQVIIQNMVYILANLDSAVDNPIQINLALLDQPMRIQIGRVIVEDTLVPDLDQQLMVSRIFTQSETKSDFLRLNYYLLNQLVLKLGYQLNYNKLPGRLEFQLNIK